MIENEATKDRVADDRNELSVEELDSVKGGVIEIPEMDIVAYPSTGNQLVDAFLNGFHKAGGH